MGKTVLVDLSHPFGRGNPLWPSTATSISTVCRHAHALSSASDLQRLPHAQLHPTPTPPPT